MASGPGVRLMVGRGLAMSPGAGRLITSAAGSITTTTGPGCRAANFIGSGVGGVRRWWLLTFHSATISAGIRCRITNTIPTHVVIDTTTAIVIAIAIRATGIHMIGDATAIMEIGEA